MVLGLFFPRALWFAEMMSTLGSFGSTWMKSSDTAAYIWLQFSNLPSSSEVVRDGFVVVLVQPHFRVSALHFSVSYHPWAFSVSFRIGYLPCSPHFSTLTHNLTIWWCLKHNYCTSCMSESHTLFPVTHRHYNKKNYFLTNKLYKSF